MTWLEEREGEVGILQSLPNRQEGRRREEERRRRRGPEGKLVSERKEKRKRERAKSKCIFY
jgi:hypothetical protein